MRKIPIPDVKKRTQLHPHIVRFASSVIRTWFMPSEAVTQPFKEISIDPKANRQSWITHMVVKAYSAWHEQDIQKAQLYMALI